MFSLDKWIILIFHQMSDKRKFLRFFLLLSNWESFRNKTFESPKKAWKAFFKERVRRVGRVTGRPSPESSIIGKDLVRHTVKSSASQPGVRIPHGVWDKSQGVRQIFINLKITLWTYFKKPFQNSLRCAKIFFFQLEGLL